MSKKLRLIAMACILFALPVFFCANASALTTKVTLVAQDDIKVYTNSSLSTVKGTLRYGEEVTYTSKGKTYTKATVTATNGNLKGKTVYLNSSQINPDADNAYFKYPRYIETSGSQKLRKTSSTSSTSRGYIARGTEMEVLGIVKNSKGTYMLKVRGVKTYTGTSNSKVKYYSKSGYTKKSYSTVAYKYYTVKDCAQIYNSACSDDRDGEACYDLNDPLKIADIHKGWAKVVFAGGTSYRYIDSSDIEPMEKHIKAKTVYLRRTTSSSSTKLATMYWNDEIKVLIDQKISGTTYSLVEHNGKTGWAITASGSSEKLGYNTTKVVNEDTLLYTNSSMIASGNNEEDIIVNEGTTVTVEYTSDNDISKVVLENGRDGFINSGKLSYRTEKVEHCGAFNTARKCLSTNSPDVRLQNTNVEIIANSTSVKISRIKDEDGNKYYVLNSSLAKYSIPPLPASFDGDMFIAKNYVRMLEKADSSSPYVVAQYLEPVTNVSKVSTNYYKVTYKNETRYIYVNASKYKLSDYLIEPYPTFDISQCNNMQKAIVSLAFDFLYNQDTFYRKSGNGWGDETNRWEFDCSNFVAYVINEAMSANPNYHWDIPGACDSTTGNRHLNMDTIVCNPEDDSDDQFKAKMVWNKATAGSTPYTRNILPGDVVMFYNGRSGRTITHVGIYVGNDSYIHCNSTYENIIRDKVMISSLSGSSDDLVKIKRFTPDDDDLLA